MVHQSQGLHAFDVRLFMVVNRMPHPCMVNRAMHVLSIVMTGGHGWLLSLIVASFFNRKRGRKALHNVLPPLWFTGITVDYPIKYYFRRRRPFVRLENTITIGRKPRSFSFPSGHAATAFGGALLMRKHYPEFTPLWYTIASLVGFSRVYLGVHYPSDVVVGALMGTLLAKTTRWAVEGIRQNVTIGKIKP